MNSSKVLLATDPDRLESLKSDAHMESCPNNHFQLSLKANPLCFTGR